MTIKTKTAKKKLYNLLKIYIFKALQSFISAYLALLQVVVEIPYHDKATTTFWNSEISV